MPQWDHIERRLEILIQVRCAPVCPKVFLRPLFQIQPQSQRHIADSPARKLAPEKKSEKTLQFAGIAPRSAGNKFPPAKAPFPPPYAQLKSAPKLQACPIPRAAKGI